MTDINLVNDRKSWRKLVKKLRRKRKRQAEASARVISISDESEEDNDSEKEAEERKRRHIQWLEDEEKAQKEWKEKENIRLEHERQKREAQERIRKEWEVAKLQKQEQKNIEERKKAELQAKIQNYIDQGGSIPEELLTFSETKPGREKCPFFSKVAACRFGPTCSRNHVVPGLSRTLLFPNCYTHFNLLQNNRSIEYDTDVNLEFDDKEMNYDFREFFEDFVPELERFGCVQVVQVCRNGEGHLRGNLYVEYSSEREALSAARGLNARWYGGRQLSASFASVPDWAAAICGDFHRGRCPKGNQCNFLHTFRNHRGYLAPKKKKPDASVRSWRWSESPDRERRPSRHRRRSRSKEATPASPSRSRQPYRSQRRSRSRSKDSRRSSPKWRSRGPYNDTRLRNKSNTPDESQKHHSSHRRSRSTRSRSQSRIKHE